MRTGTGQEYGSRGPAVLQSVNGDAEIRHRSAGGGTGRVDNVVGYIAITQSIVRTLCRWVGRCVVGSLLYWVTRYGCVVFDIR